MAASANGWSGKTRSRPSRASGRAWLRAGRSPPVADVVAVNAAKQTVRLRGVERTIDLKVRDPKQFALVKVGDQVEVTFTEAVALSVEPVAAAPKAAPKK